MSERVRTVFKKLFEIKILHHYWLDEGDTVFDFIADSRKKADRLQTYDVRKIVSITPDEPTAKALQTYRCVYRTTAQGLVVMAVENIEIPVESVFTWILTVKDVEFFNYTAMTLSPQTVYRLTSDSRKRVFFYKADVPVLSNNTGTIRENGDNRTLFLSQPYAGISQGDTVEALVVSGNVLNQLISDQPGAAIQNIGSPVSEWPVFVHRIDSPGLNPPEDLAGAPPRGIELNGSIPESVFALIKIQAISTVNPLLSIVEPSGQIKSEAPIFEIRFKNRSTIWRYFSKQDGAFQSEEAEPLPLTYFGVIGTKQKPVAGLIKVEREGAANSRITGLISEIFV